jgi:hypothetical protein
MSIGLDLAGERFRSLRRHGDRLIARTCSASYAIILDNPARRELFAERRVPFAEFGMNLILFGDAAVEWADRLSVSAIPLCLDDRLRLDDRIVRKVFAALIEGLLPIPEIRPDDCCLTIPGGLKSYQPVLAEFLVRVLRDLGYRLSITSQGLAVALSELSEFGMTGIGVHLGATGTEFSIVRQGRELGRFDVRRGIGRLPALSEPRDDTDSLGPSEEGIERQLREIFASAAFELARRPEGKALATPVALAVGGELVADSQIAALVPLSAQHASWPFVIRTVRLAADAHWTVSRGCLIQAELDQLADQSLTAA